MRRKRMRLIAACCAGMLLIAPAAASRAQSTSGSAAATQADAEEENAQAAYYGVIGKRLTVYKWGDEDAPVLGTVETGTVVDVYKKGRTWTQIGFEGDIGSVLTKFVERVQRKDPFEGPMPGTSEHVAVGYVLSDTSFLPEGYRYAIEVSRGSWLSIEEIREGRAYFPYRREEEPVSVSTDKLKIYDFVAWDEAQPGDLLYAFTTFYSTNTKKEGNANRMYNIALASERLTSIRVPEGESFSFNSICGPYTKENGYRSAPILSGESAMGYGGGVCQVCSTLYNIVLRVPAVVEDMNWHSQGGVSYLPAGFDATVSDTKDMVFRNVLPYDVRIEFESLDGVMTAFLFRDYET
ncbi:MAG TPA: VanW family protein [Candidatus Ventricola intestinavium]|nr:VanW family protein [Candidatus Ventricola intestinavium]